MKSVLKIIGIAFFAGFIIIQLFRVDKTNPPVVASETLSAAVAVPPEVFVILGRSCNDCHSNTTRYPWYANVQPAGWFLRDHIDHGRSHLNFSVFNTYSPQKKAKALDEICEQVEAAAMPLPSYLWIHGEASLQDGDARTLCEWANREREKLVSTTETAVDGT